ncbi:MAG: hypothetical protein ACR2MD_17645 [Aridibacter sp.]|jgi:hypothetical protein|nr:hypothetical protein [Acidobacteriota bacterium]
MKLLYIWKTNNYLLLNGTIGNLFIHNTLHLRLLSNYNPFLMVLPKMKDEDDLHNETKKIFLPKIYQSRFTLA